ncbi:MAG: hypothetical protein HYW24_03345 [Candidatus Aenigmarchaeota archaeon]|nr:hypothetical protein [Candidatus Aenigmarchaeota archaeon]
MDRDFIRKASYESNFLKSIGYKAATGTLLLSLLLPLGCRSGRTESIHNQPSPYTVKVTTPYVTPTQIAISTPTKTYTQIPTSTSTPTQTSTPTPTPLRELPGDILTDQELKELGITITNLSDYEFYLRKGALEFPGIRRSKEDLIKSKRYGSKGDEIVETTLNFFLFDNHVLTPDEYKKIPIDYVRDLLIKESSESSFNGQFVSAERHLPNGKLKMEYYVLVATGSNVLSTGRELHSRNDLPAFPDIDLEQAESPGYLNLKRKKTYDQGQRLSIILRHEILHFLTRDEWEADKYALKSLQEAERMYREKGDDSGYPFVFRDRRNGVIIRTRQKRNYRPHINNESL